MDIQNGVKNSLAVPQEVNVQNYHMTQQFHFYVYSLKELKISSQTFAHKYSQQHYPQQSKGGNNLSISEQTNRFWSIHTVDYDSVIEGMKCWFMLYRWTLENIRQGKEVRHKRSHVIWFHLYETFKQIHTNRKQIAGCQRMEGVRNGEITV